MAPTHSRKSSSSSSRGGAFQPPVQPPDESVFAFANAFWSFSGKKGSASGSALVDDGREGYETLMSRMKLGSKTLEEMRALFKERASMEDDHAKKLGRLSKSNAGNGESGLINLAIQQIKEEILGSAKAHSDLGELLRLQEAKIGDFLSKREAARKNQQHAVEKLYRTKKEQMDALNKAKTKYETDALDITGMGARAALSQGRELDKVTMKMEKIQQTVLVNERDYKNFVAVLKETTTQWNQQWRAYCDLCQDQEEERLDFLKSRLWDWANALSTVAVAEDESAERSRTALEQCEPAKDLMIFVQAAGTGNEIPDPPVFVDYKVHAAPPNPTYKAARFPRSSTRDVRNQHAPSAVDEITSAFKVAPPAQQAQLPQQSTPQRAIQQQQQQQQQQQPARPRSNSQGVRNAAPGQGNPGGAPASMHPSGRPNFAPEDLSPTKSQSNMANLENALSRPPTDTTQPLRPGFPTNNSSSTRFPVSPRALADRPPVVNTAPGTVTAHAFQQRRPTNPPTSVTEAPTASPAPARYDPAPAQPLAEEDPTDPIIRAIHELKASEAAMQPLRNSRSFTGPMAGAVALPGMASAPTQRAPSPSYRDQQSPQGYPRSPSPAPTASLMQPPRDTGAPPAVQSSYGPAFPGERSNSRPSSRQGSIASQGSRISQSSPPRNAPERAPSPQPFVGAGVGANGRSPSPQPFTGPGGNRNSQSWQQQQAPPPQQQQSQYQGGGSPGLNIAPLRPLSPLAPFDGAAPGQGQGYRAPSPSQQYAQPGYQQPQAQYGGPLTGPPQGYPQQQQQQQQQGGYQNGYGGAPAAQPEPPRQPSPQPAAVPPTGQYDHEGRPILFYVNAIYNYQAAAPEEFSFAQGDVIAVTATDPDGWWQGSPVGIIGGGHIFPSNFTELLQ